MTTTTSEDTEITLGTGKMLALFFGLVALCAVFFGMGFSLGKNSVKSGSDPLAAGTGPGGARPTAVKSNSPRPDRKSTRLNSSHLVISYAVFCLKKKKH